MNQQHEVCKLHKVSNLYPCIVKSQENIYQEDEPDLDNVVFGSKSSIELLNCGNFEEFWKTHKSEFVAGDGHCLLNALLSSIAFQLPHRKCITNEILVCMIESEVLSNVAEYSAYLTNHSDIQPTTCEKGIDVQSDLVEQLYDYTINKNWRTPFGDMVPMIAAKFLGINIGIISVANRKYEYRCVFSEQQADDYVVVYYTGNHYDAISIVSCSDASRVS